MPGSIHHIEWCVSDISYQVRNLVSNFGFNPIGQRTRKINSIWKVQQILVKSGETVFLITQKSRTSDLENGKIFPDIHFFLQSIKIIDTFIIC